MSNSAEDLSIINSANVAEPGFKLNAKLLSNPSLNLSKVRLPSYNRDQVKVGVVHFGVGGFHRSHQAKYLNDYMDLFALSAKDGMGSVDLEWGICGIGVMPNDKKMLEILKDQDYLFTLIEKDSQEERVSVIGSIVDYIYAPEDSSRAISVLTAPATKIVSLTITESGYSGVVINADSAIPTINSEILRQDIANIEKPQSAFGYIVRALQIRREQGLQPFVVLSCDNVQENGAVAKKSIVGFAKHINSELADWISSKVLFPNTMVDRITPATTDEHIKELKEQYQISDSWPVVCETFSQWVIEKWSVASTGQKRPELEKVGVQFVENVAPYEKMKLRLLNASHSAMGYLGYLCGYRFIDDVARDSQFATYVRAMMDLEVTDMLDPVPGIDLDQYKTTLLERFANPAIRDQVLRICMDGSGKIPKFILPSIADRMKNHHIGSVDAVLVQSISRLCLVLAAWFKFLSGVDERGQEIPIVDPMSSELTRVARNGSLHEFQIQEIFGDTKESQEIFSKSGAVFQETNRLLSSLNSVGARKTLESLL